MHARRSAFLALSWLALAGTGVLAQEVPVLPKEIQDTWVGRELWGTTVNGVRAVMRLDPDGTASIAAGNTQDTGTWRLSEQGYCTTWKTIRAGTERCFTVVRNGGTYKVINPDGSTGGLFNGIR